MRVLVVADIHGNRAALEAIREPFDACVCSATSSITAPNPARASSGFARTPSTAFAATTTTASPRMSPSRASPASGSSPRSPAR